MLQKYGQDSFALLVDEGGKYNCIMHIQISILIALALVGLFSDMEGSVIAIASIAEKGKLDTRVRVSTPGGHSSIPPAHTVSCNIFSVDFI